MNSTRRSFLKKSGLFASGLALGSLPVLGSCSRAEAEGPVFGLQLYTLRHIIADDPAETLRQVAAYGYRQIESYEGPSGMYWGMGNSGFKQLMDELDMTMISSHADVFQDFERKAEEAAEIGVEYLVCPWIGSQGSIDGYKEMAENFNEIGRIAASSGIKFAYHNHAYTFEEMEGEIPQDVLMEHTDPELVEYQMDIYWVVAGGHNPADWFRKYPGRFTTSHVKDITGGENPESTILGTGLIDFPAILQTGRENGLQYLIVEQEAYTDTTPMGAIRENAIYMQELGL